MIKPLIGIMVAVIILVAVVVPTVIDITTDANLTGTSATILGYFPLLLIVGGLLLVISLYR